MLVVFKIKHNFLKFLVIMLMTQCAFARGDGLTAGIIPDKNIQTFFRKFLSQDASVRESLFTKEELKIFKENPTDEKKQLVIIRKKIKTIEVEAGGTEKILLQLLYLKSHANDVGPAMMPVYVIHALRVAPDLIIRTVLPYIDSEDDKLKKAALDFMEIAEYDPEIMKMDFAAYEKIIRETMGKVPCRLIKYMYAKSPCLALSTMANVYMTKDDADNLREQIKNDDESKTLDLLSRRPEWWIQLYVAEYYHKAFELPMEPLDKCYIVSCWGKALQNMKQHRDQQKKIGEIYLQGIAITLENTESTEIKEPPPVGKLRYVGNSLADEVAMRKQHQKEMDARKKVQADNKFIEYRTQFAQECTSAFAQTADGLNEYQLMANKHLGNHKYIREQIAETIRKKISPQR